MTDLIITADGVTREIRNDTVLVKSMLEYMSTLRTVRDTLPPDWVLDKDRDGKVAHVDKKKVGAYEERKKKLQRTLQKECEDLKEKIVAAMVTEARQKIDQSDLTGKGANVAANVKKDYMISYMKETFKDPSFSDGVIKSTIALDTSLTAAEIKSVVLEAVKAAINTATWQGCVLHYLHKRDAEPFFRNGAKNRDLRCVLHPSKRRVQKTS